MSDIDLDNLEDAVVVIAKRTMKRIKQKSYKGFENKVNVVAEVQMKTNTLSHILADKASTKKDIQSKLTEVAVACILGIEFLEREYDESN